MTARGKFKIGDVVERSIHGATMNVPMKHCKGVVVGFADKSPDLVRVKIERQAHARMYFSLFWDVVSSGTVIPVKSSWYFETGFKPSITVVAEPGPKGRHNHLEETFVWRGKVRRNNKSL